MKRLILVMIVLALSGCANMTPKEQLAWTVVGVVVVGSLAASGSSSSTPAQNCYVTVDAGGSNQVCR